jgi:hypothetical protein
MRALTDFVRRYGVIMSSYVFLACMVWIVLMILVPQAVMVSYTFWYEDKNLVGDLYSEIDANYARLDDMDFRVEEIEEELPKATAAEKTTLESERDQIVLDQKKIETLLVDLELQYDAARKAVYWGTRNYEYLLANEDHRVVF